MSIDKFHFVANEKTTDIEHTEAAVLCSNKRAHSIYVMWGGVEHLFIFEDGAQAVETFGNKESAAITCGPPLTNPNKSNEANNVFE